MKTVMNWGAFEFPFALFSDASSSPLHLLLVLILSDEQLWESEVESERWFWRVVICGDFLLWLLMSFGWLCLLCRMLQWLWCCVEFCSDLVVQGYLDTQRRARRIDEGEDLERIWGSKESRETFVRVIVNWLNWEGKWNWKNWEEEWSLIYIVIERVD